MLRQSYIFECSVVVPGNKDDILEIDIISGLSSGTQAIKGSQRASLHDMILAATAASNAIVEKQHFMGMFCVPIITIDGTSAF